MTTKLLVEAKRGHGYCLEEAQLAAPNAGRLKWDLVFVNWQQPAGSLK